MAASVDQVEVRVNDHVVEIRWYGVNSDGKTYFIESDGGFTVRVQSLRVVADLTLKNKNQPRAASNSNAAQRFELSSEESTKIQGKLKRFDNAHAYQLGHLLE